VAVAACESYDGHMALGGSSFSVSSSATDASGEPERSSCPACESALAAPSLSSTDRLCGLPGVFSVARCKRCGMGVTWPMVDGAQLGSFYPTSYATHDSLPSGTLGLVSKAVERVQSWQALRTAPLDRLAGLPAGRLLDVGCGRGDLGSWFVRRGWSVVGVEPAAHACAVAESRGVQARVGTLASVEIEPGTFDAVVFRHSLEHVADPVGDLRRAREALCDGGVAIVSVPNFGCWQSRCFGGSWFQLDLPRHRFHFNAGALRMMLAHAGFGAVETTTTSSSIGLPGSVQYAFAGRCLFPHGLKQRVAVALCAPLSPFIRLLNGLAGEGDVLHAVAYTRR
jgi:2-polyprenyl-3-methyl-5-hydroxy-6-metoxy-1,4-benzoquinol methylase